MDPLIAGESAMRVSALQGLAAIARSRRSSHGAPGPYTAGGRSTDRLDAVLLMRAPNYILSLNLAEGVTSQIVFTGRAQRIRLADRPQEPPHGAGL